jgi:hypothetical protein
MMAVVIATAVAVVATAVAVVVTATSTICVGSGNCCSGGGCKSCSDGGCNCCSGSGSYLHWWRRRLLQWRRLQWLQWRLPIFAAAVATVAVAAVAIVAMAINDKRVGKLLHRINTDCNYPIVRIKRPHVTDGSHLGIRYWLTFRRILSAYRMSSDILDSLSNFKNHARRQISIRSCPIRFYGMRSSSEDRTLRTFVTVEIVNVHRV